MFYGCDLIGAPGIYEFEFDKDGNLYRFNKQSGEIVAMDGTDVVVFSNENIYEKDKQSRIILEKLKLRNWEQTYKIQLKDWEAIKDSPNYAKRSIEEKQDIRRGWFKKEIMVLDEFIRLSESKQEDVKNEFFSSELE